MLTRVVLVCAVLLGVAVESADARVRWRRRRAKSHTTYSVRFGGTPSQVAQQKAAYIASRGGGAWHPGGSYGGANAEGVGYGATAAAAYENCCFRGQRRIAGQAHAWCQNGMCVAVTLYW